jgi:hypothetical protein
MKELQLPNPACAAICRNAMNEVCIEECSPKRDCSFFEIRPDLSLPDMPAYPDTSGMTWKERFVVEEAYLKKTIDFIQGRKREIYDYSPSFPGRSLHNSEGHNGDNRTEAIYSVQQDSLGDETL